MGIALLVIAALLAGGVVWNAVWLVWRRHSPRSMLGSGLAGAVYLGVLGLMGLLPAVVNWIWWALVVMLVAALGIAAWRATRPPAGVERTGPGPVSLIANALVVLVVVVLAFLSG